MASYGKPRSNTKRDAYAGVDLEQARQIGALLGVIGILASVSFLWWAPPTARLGAAGWGLAGLLLSSAVIASVCAWRSVSFDQGLLLAYLGLVQVGLAEWLAGGYGSPYHELFVLPLVYVAAVYPAGRVAIFTLVTTATATLPLLYDGWTAHAAGIIAAQDMVWIGLALVAYRLMTRVRAQRIHSWKREGEARELARVDVLTGLGNRRAFDEILDRELARYGRTGNPLTIAIGDVDGFKGINDSLGHVRGDECLRRVGAAIEEEVRRPDACFRWGGDEFVIVLPDADRSAAERVTARLIEAVEHLCSTPDGASLSMTFGFAEAAPGSTSDGLVESADGELMANKPELRVSGPPVPAHG